MVNRVPRWGFVQWVGAFRLTAEGERSFCLAVENGVREVLKRAVNVQVEGATSGVPEGGEFAVLYPTLFEHMTQQVWDDGTPRKPSSVTIFCDGPVMKLVLKDHGAKVCLWMAAPSMDGLFTLVESALLDPATVWRLDRQDNDGSSKRVKPKG